MDIFAIIGLTIFFIGGLGLLIAAFRTNVLWGIGIILFAPAALIFVILNWNESKNPFFLQLLGLVITYFSSSGLQAL